MKNIHSKIAIVLGILLVIPTLLEGTSVILGKEQAGMVVLPWLVYYNVGMALFSLFAVYNIWKEHPAKLKVVSIVLLGHLTVWAILLVIYFTSGAVATKSIMAMTMRSSIWALIGFLVRKG
jgi:hypothetical protein